MPMQRTEKGAALGAVVGVGELRRRLVEPFVGPAVIRGEHGEMARAWRPLPLLGYVNTTDPKAGRKPALAIVLYDLCARDTARRFSPHCWKARMALAHKGLDFETRATPFTKIREIGDGFSPTVPVIDDGGKLVRDSFDIALYLEATYPDRPTLFGGEGGKASARFVESWALTTVHPPMMGLIVKDIHDRLGDDDQTYFRENREKRMGRTLEEAQAGREERLEAWRAGLQPLRHMLGRQPFIGGDAPLFADYIVFGPLQWARVISPFRLLAEGDPVAVWFERCLDLHGGIGRAMPAAA